MDVSTSSFRATAPAATNLPGLGPLAEFIGSWKGRGFNMISLPDFENSKPFRLMLNATMESFEAQQAGGPIPNRGSKQNDIAYLGVRYLQQISDAATGGGLHIEPGLWLNLPATTAPKSGPTVARMGSVPHGDAFLAEGTSTVIDGPPTIPSTDATPFTVDKTTGARVNETSEKYLEPFQGAPPVGIPQAAILDPNVVLNDAIAGQKIVSTTTLDISANPVGGINGTPIVPPGSANGPGGITNIPFIVENANAVSFAATFWLETVEGEAGQFLQMQYTQTVVLDFIDILWPHISVATLIKH